MKTLFIVKMISAFLVSQLFVFGNGMAYSIENPLHVTPIPNKTVLKVESIGANRSTLSFKRLLNTSGKVYSIQQGKKTSAESNTKKVKVVIEKTDGKAKTEVRVCLLSEGVGLGLTTVKKTYVFENGNYTRKKKCY